MKFNFFRRPETQNATDSQLKKDIQRMQDLLDSQRAFNELQYERNMSLKEHIELLNTRIVLLNEKRGKKR